jgi:DNA-binding IclR family transcriptional regulator
VLLCCACAAKKKAIEKAGERDKLEQEKEENTRKEEENTEQEILEPEGENQVQREDAERETEVSSNVYCVSMCIRDMHVYILF